jgi:hypothetical protein
MKQQVYKWNEQQQGELALQTVLSQHQATGHFRVSPGHYPAGTKFVGVGRARRLYVLAGECSLKVDKALWYFSGPSYADIPEGEFSFVVKPITDTSIISVFKIPEQFRNGDNEEA